MYNFSSTIYHPQPNTFVQPSTKHICTKILGLNPKWRSRTSTRTTRIQRHKTKPELMPSNSILFSSNHKYRPRGFILKSMWLIYKPSRSTHTRDWMLHGKLLDIQDSINPRLRNSNSNLKEHTNALENRRLSSPLESLNPIFSAQSHLMSHKR